MASRLHIQDKISDKVDRFECKILESSRQDSPW